MKLSKAFFSLAKTPLGDLIIGIAFGKLSGMLPVNKVRETDLVIAFWHPKPYWEKHILLVPKKAIKNLTEIKPTDYKYINEVYRIAKEIVQEWGLNNTDYSLLTNGGKRQEVNQLHFHLYSGAELNDSFKTAKFRGSVLIARKSLEKNYRRV